jgi:cysteinyl-tRNA synthetase
LYREISSYGKPAKAVLEDYDKRFLTAINDDLDMPKALTIVKELIDSVQPYDLKLTTLIKFDEVLGLNLRDNVGGQIPEEVSSLVRERQAARVAKDWGKSDELRKKIAELGYEVVDSGENPKLKKIIN